MSLWGATHRRAAPTARDRASKAQVPTAAGGDPARVACARGARGVRIAQAAGRLAALALAAGGCTTVDPGPDFVVADVTFDSNFFYCEIEPQLIFQYRCGPGDPSKGDPPNGCHFNPSAVSGMALIDHPAVDCDGGDTVVDTTQIGTGSPAESNYEAVSFEMSQQWMTAPLYVRPSGNSHPRQIFAPDDMTVTQLLSAWAAR